MPGRRRVAPLPLEPLEPRLLLSVAGIGGEAQSSDVQITNVVTSLDSFKDNTLYENVNGTVSNGSGQYMIAGVTAGQGNFAARRGLLAFDLSSVVSAGSQIISASLTLHMSRTIAGPQDVSLHRVLTDWGEGASNAPSQEGDGAVAESGDATWLHTQYDTDLWTTAGGDFAPTASASTSVDGIDFYSWSSAQLVADVQAWLDNSSANFGWMLIGNEATDTTTKRFDTREHPTPANRPVLMIEYDGDPSATLPHTEDFSDAVADFFVPVSGVWSVINERYEGGPAVPGSDAITLLDIGDSLPTQTRISAGLYMDDAASLVNAYLIFDYQSAADFKFAGGDSDASQWEIGHFDGTNWITDTSQSSAVFSNNSYAQLVLNDTMATLDIDGDVVATFDFGVPLNGGQVGLATRDAEAAFDDYIVEQVVLSASLPHWDTFDEGAANFFTAMSGDWFVNSARKYRGNAPSGDDALSLITLTGPLPDDYLVEVVMRSKMPGAKKNAYVIFDYQNVSDFKYAGAAMNAGNWRVGHFDGTNWLIDASFAETIDVNVDYDVRVWIEDTTAKLLVGGVEKTSFDFGESLSDGQIGLGTNNAEAVFDNLALREGPGSIHGMKWIDLDSDGVFDPNDGEMPLEGETVFLDSNGNHLFDDYELSTTTNANGEYSFTDLDSGDYMVGDVVRAGWEQTYHGSLYLPIGMEKITGGLSLPVFATAPSNDTNQLFIAEQHTAQIKIFSLNTNQVIGVLLDIDDVATGVEQGLLGFAFDPDYDTNGYLYVYMIHASGDTMVRRYQASAADPGNEKLVDPDSAVTVITYAQPFTNHNAGWIGFGPDGYLYINSGDGEPGGDPNNHAQDITDQKLGKILRLDVSGDDFPADSDRNYAIPPDNPFVGITGDDEIWAYGLRNPWRASFDRLTGDLFVADVGQAEREEINFQPVGAAGGSNYGWRVMEGTFCFNNNQADGNPPCNDPSFTVPIFEYGHGPGPDGGFSVTGGYVYRGPIEQVAGRYFFGDFITGQIWSFQYDGSTVSGHTNLTQRLVPSDASLDMIVSFAEDATGNLYILDYDGDLFRIFEDTSWGIQRVTVASGEAVGSIDFGNLPLPLPLPHTEKFSSGEAVFFHHQQGLWQVRASGKYRADSDGVDSISLLRETSGPLPADLLMGSVVLGRTSGGQKNAAVLFDYQNPSDFKFVASFFDDAGDLARGWHIGHVAAGVWVSDVWIADTIAPTTNYALHAIISGDQVTMRVDGQDLATHDFGQPLNDGRIGLATRDASALFDNVVVKDLSGGGVRGLLFDDLDGDGVFDPGAGETPVAGRTVFIDLDDDGQRDAGELTTTTDANGEYEFSNLPPQDYAVAQELPFAWDQTSPASTLFDHITAVRIMGGLDDPLFVTAPPGDMDRLFILERGGGIRIFNRHAGILNNMDFLMVPDVSSFVEQALAGLAFHPDYATNGYFYVNYTGLNGDTIIQRYTVSSDNPDLADPSSKTAVLTIVQPTAIHNGGWMGFDPDGMLVITSGDGGPQNDPDNAAQDITDQALGKILRLDIDGDDFPTDAMRNYAIPPDNPFVGVTGDDEIWAYGLRNPWRASFDRLTGDFYIGDVGDALYEEIDFQPAGVGGQNYGWRVMEGPRCDDSSQFDGNPPCNHPSLTPPLYEYTHGSEDNEGNSVTAGYVYRGPIEPLQGKFFFGDFMSARIWSIEHDGTQVTEFVDWTDSFAPDSGHINYIAGWGEDAEGNVYIADLDGDVFRIEQRGAVGTQFVTISPGQTTSGVDFGGVASALPHFEDFEDSRANFFTPQAGAWDVTSNGQYRGVPDTGSEVISLFEMSQPVPTDLQLDAIINVKVGGGERNGFVIFDYQGPEAFKFAGADIDAGAWVIGHFDSSGWIVDASLNGLMAINTDYDVRVLVQDQRVTLLVGGVEKTSFDYAIAPLAGSFGLGMRDAVVRFDDFGAAQAAALGGAILPHFDDFDDLTADFFEAQLGSWFINGALRYRPAPAPGSDAISLITLADSLPNNFQVDAALRGKASGNKQNAYIIFDYQGPTDFKYAGAAMGSGQWRIGHFDGTNWMADALFAETIDLGVDYAVQVMIDGTEATLLVRGVEKMSFDFGDLLNDGRVGLATHDANAVFDNFAVGLPADGATLPHFEDFDDDTADFFHPQMGDWFVNGANRYRGEAATDFTDAVSVISLSDPLPANFVVDAVIQGKNSGLNRNALIIFDYRDPGDFKFAGGFFGVDKWKIGRFDGASWISEATVFEVIRTDINYEAELIIEGNTARLVVGGVEKVSHDFGAALNGGLVGVGTRIADAVFNDFRIESYTDGASASAVVNRTLAQALASASATLPLRSQAKSIFDSRLGATPWLGTSDREESLRAVEII